MNRIKQLFEIQYPIIQGGMIWCSGWRLASAVSNAGGLGLLGAGSMYPDVLEEHIIKCKNATDKPFGVNIPLLSPYSRELVETALRSGVRIFFTSAGNPKMYTSYLKEAGARVVHVVPNLKFAVKCVEAGVDAIVAEGFEAGGHNGIEETTTMALIPLIKRHIDLPVIAAGGIAGGRSVLAALALGADGVQIGSRFAVSAESSAHENFKNRVVEASEGETRLMMKKVVPVRLLNNAFSEKIHEAESRGASKEELQNLLGSGRAKKGMMEGDMENGELEIGQVSSVISSVQPVAAIMQDILQEYAIALNEISGNKNFTD